MLNLERSKFTYLSECPNLSDIEKKFSINLIKRF